MLKNFYKDNSNKTSDRRGPKHKNFILEKIEKLKKFEMEKKNKMSSEDPLPK